MQSLNWCNIRMQKKPKKRGDAQKFKTLIFKFSLEMNAFDDEI